MNGSLIITGTDTGVGKTVFSAALAGAADAMYWKPVQAGLDEETDSALVARLSGLQVDRILPEAYRLNTPCSPHRAAEIDGIVIDPARLNPPLGERNLVIEGAGGALVPITRDLLFADLFARGTINHSLLSIEALRTRGLDVIGVAFVGAANEDSEATIAELGKVRRLGRLPMLDNLDRDALARAFAAHFRIADFAA
jgi:dethiobiotin synthetase